MAKQKKESFFWTSYSDLMTSLFFIMLVLFVLTVSMLHKRLAEVIATNEQLERILKIDEQFKPLQESDVFQYYPKSKKFVAKDFIGVEIFSPNQDNILPEYQSSAIQIGKEIEKQLKKLSEDNPDFKYQLVIEGNVANSYDYKYDEDGIFGYELSYRRALALYLLWKSNSINLRKYNTEVLICGSGWNGLDRDSIEENNKRFSIQIIPKITSPSINKTK